MRKAQQKNKMAQRKRQAVKISLPRLRLPAWRIGLRHVFFASFLLIVSAIIYGGFYAIDAVLEVPVEEVKVRGEFRYLDQAEIGELIGQYVDDGFMQVNLKRLYQELAALPWVYKVIIKRELPNGLSIQMEEQRIAAYWNDNALINQYGEVFEPAVLPRLNGVPQFSGKNHEQVLELYAQLLEKLSANERPIRALRIDQRNTMTVVIRDEASLVMKLDQVDEQLGRWQHIAQSLGSEQLNKIKRVDLRYSNGAAVEWRKDIAALAPSYRGGHH